MTHVPETGGGKMGVDFRRWFLERVSQVLHNRPKQMRRVSWSSINSYSGPLSF